jgi:hypothetical protein
MGVVVKKEPVARGMSPHAFAMHLPPIEAYQQDVSAKRAAKEGSDILRRAMMAYYHKHHWK